MIEYNEARKEWDFLDENGDFVQEADKDGNVRSTYPCANMKSYFDDLVKGEKNTYFVHTKKLPNA
jgi:hypothetical protein